MALGAWVSGAETIVRRLAGCYEDIARLLDINLVDAGSWGIDLTLNGVYFSETGYLAFAKGINQTMSALFST